MTMHPAETTRLLTYIAGLDPRMTPRDDSDAKTRVAAWSDLLRDAEYPTAKTLVERYYRNADNTYPITVNVIAAGCRPNPKWEERQEHKQLAGRPIPEDVREQIDHLLGRDPHEIAARRIPCPWSPCHASPGSACNLSSGRSHPSRMDAARAAA